MYDMKYESKVTNGKKRVRASQACVHCRKKKIKCDENKPSCTQCQEANVICEYTEPKKRGPRKGYVQLLEERLGQMERKLMGPGIINTSMSDEDNSRSLSSSPINNQPSPIQLYKNLERSSDLPSVEIVNHLVDIFFKYINSVFPVVHRAILKKQIQDGTVSRPLLYSVLAISARFSDHPMIKTNPPYLAGEQFAEKALSLVDASTLQPNLKNIQFWAIMSCLEYGRASGSKSWIYGGLAIRFCQELGYYKEETLSTPILAEDGSIDTVTMALRRRVFWSCLSIDKLSSAGTHRPQCIERSDCDVNAPNISECLILRDPTFHRNSEGQQISDDSLMNIVKYYMKIIESYGEVNRFMNRAKSSSASILWPPIAEFRNLDIQLRSWKDTLPELFQFNARNLEHHRRYASANYLNVWLSSHAVWCSSMMVLHRGSLAFSDVVKPTETISEDLYRRIQTSIDICRLCVDAAMGVFESIKELCGYNTLPYMGYSAYVFATVLMTSTFSSTPESCKKSNRGLKILYDLIDGLRPYWPMCERLANATNELLLAHQKLYQQNMMTSSASYPSYPYNVSPSTNDPTKLGYPPVHKSSPVMNSPSTTHSSSSVTMASPPMQRLVNSNSNNSQMRTGAPPLSSLLGQTTTTTEPAILPPYYNQYDKSSQPYIIPSSSASQQQQQQSFFNGNTTRQPEASSSSALAMNWNRGNEIDFNSLEFLYDTGLFGQVVFDVMSNHNSPTSSYVMQAQPYINTAIPLNASNPSTTTVSTTTTTHSTSAFQSILPPQSSSSVTYKSLWN
ncbi:MAG: fungal-specific transcription factor domain-containing protein [Benjaminiella poitrasii]|nr:MAG: fungal-specific transcription factor domain-containing protein [Benjaminiella poitrasii]